MLHSVFVYCCIELCNVVDYNVVSPEKFDGLYNKRFIVLNSNVDTRYKYVYIFDGENLT